MKLTMSAFGSYADVEIVDFELVGHGIFLITGDTGSGKTTIFDAVSYALFGETSGQRRDPSMMRSQYADGDKETYVSFQFLEQGKRYEITRSPSYLRSSKRKNKDGEYTQIVVSAKATLILPEGVEYAGNIRDINQKIEEIIGVDLSQFSQIAMIAQGDYLKLLLASSKERKEIFSRIFNTGIYSRIQAKLKEKNNHYSELLEDNRKLCIHELNNVELLPESIYAEEWLKLKEWKETKTEELLSQLSAIINEIQQKENLLLMQVEQTSEILTDLEKKRSLAEEQNRLFDRKKEAALRLEALEGKKADWKIKQDQLIIGELAEKAYTAETQYKDKKYDYETAYHQEIQLNVELKKTEEAFALAKNAAAQSREASETEVPQLTILIDRLASSMPLYEKWEEIDKLCQVKKREEEKYKTRVVKLEQELTEISDRFKEYEEKQSMFALKAGKRADLKQKKEEHLGRNEALINLSHLLERFQTEQSELADCRNEEIARQTAYEEAELLYTIRYQNFIALQAGIMAQTLEEGIPCPVCGSIHHPKKADLQGETITADLVDEARLKRDEANEQRSKAAMNTIQKYESCRHQEAFIKKEAEIWLGSEFEWDSLLDRLMKERAEGKRLFEAVQGEEKEAIEAETCLNELLENRQADQNRAEALKEEREKLREEWQNQKVENAALVAEREQLRKSLPYPQKEEAKRQQEKGKERRQALLSLEKQTNERFLRLSEEEREMRGRLHSLRENKESLFSSLTQTREAYDTLILKLGFSSEEEYLKAKMPQERINTWQQEIKKYEEERLTASTIYHQYEEQTKGRERIDTLPWEKESESLREKQKNLQMKSAEVAGMKSRAGRAECILKKLWKEREKLEASYQLYHGLNQTANGKLSVSLDFQTYVQRQYFNQMVHAANRRLKIMADGQFLLQCRDLNSLKRQGEVGLDLDVYSLATGQVRDVKTLSGGESFMAALAMALGMADIIQRTAGNVRMDAMFIDEGFGSLDEESRLRAVRILLELAGEHRLIGIISHVSELKEQIDRKLTVTKSESGSKIRWEFDHTGAS